MLITLSKGLLAAAGLVSLGVMVRGLIDMQRINTADGDVIETRGIVRRLTGRKGHRTKAELTLNVDDTAQTVECLLPGKRRHRVTDVVPVYWRRGEPHAVAVSTIRGGQGRFLLGFLALAAAAVAAVMLYR